MPQPLSDNVPSGGDQGGMSVGAGTHDAPLRNACTRLRNVRPAFRAHVATSWAQLRAHTQPLAHLGAFPGGPRVLAAALESAPVRTARLSEGEAAAVLLYTAEKVAGASVYAPVNAALRSENPRPCALFVSTLVSALRKLRACAPPVRCAVRWTDCAPAPGEAHYVARAFLSATAGLSARPRTIYGHAPVALVPHAHRAALLPPALSFHAAEHEVVFEPSTAFRRVAPGVYEELPPVPPNTAGAASAVIAPGKNAPDALLPELQTQLLFPSDTRFVPLPPDTPPPIFSSIATPLPPLGDPSQSGSDDDDDSASM